MNEKKIKEMLKIVLLNAYAQLQVELLDDVSQNKTIFKQKFRNTCNLYLKEANKLLNKVLDGTEEEQKQIFWLINKIDETNEKLINEFINEMIPNILKHKENEST